MGMGVPIICNDIGDTGYIVEQTEAGVVITDFSNATYKEAVSRMNHLTSISKEKIRAGAFAYYDLSNGVKSYLKAYKEVNE